LILDSQNITVNNPYSLGPTRLENSIEIYGPQRVENYIDTNTWSNWEDQDIENGITSIEVNPNELIFKDSRGFEHRINTNNTSHVSSEVANLQSRVTALDDRVQILEGDNAMLIDKLNKLGDIVLDLKNQVQKQAKQKLMVNFGN